MQNVIEVDRLYKKFGDLTAVDHISFCVEEGEIFGMVGPNGAGKTTTIECIEGLRDADDGEITIFGNRMGSDKKSLFEKIGVQLQESSLPPRLKVSEALELFASFYKNHAYPEKLIGELGLSEKSNAPYAKLSGGQKQRLFIALALINQPKIVFLDELTTGLDPQARRSIWELVRQVRSHGCTVFLTTHYMEEAERLCDRVLILDHGRIIALDSPAALVQKTAVDIQISFSLPLNTPAPNFGNIPLVNRVEQIDDRVLVSGKGDRFISRMMIFMEDEKIPFYDLHIEQPNLDGVFLALTGRAIRE
jgi:ABC-2 type transport system ATP-binding protein